MKNNNSFKEKFINFSNNNIFILFILNLLMLSLILPEASQSIATATGNSHPPSHAMLHSPQVFYHTIAKYGDFGRNQYSFVLLTARLIFPILCSLLLCGIIFQISQNTHLKASKAFILFPLIFPLIAFIKNTSLAFLLHQFPQKHPLLLSFTALLNYIQWVAIFGFIILVFISFIFLSKKHFHEHYF